MVFLGTEARATGRANRYQLQTRCVAVHRNVYVPAGGEPAGGELTASDKAVAAWLWSGRRATAAGLSAAALHGSLWIDPTLPAELNQASRSRPPGILIHSDALAADEICAVRGIAVTTPARTAFDLGRRRGRSLAVLRVDAMLQACDIKLTEVQDLVDRHRGVRGLVQLREVLELADYGAESPQETRTRLVLTFAGLRPTATQIKVYDGRHLVGRIDMGWPEWKVGVQYDGIQHWTDPQQRTRDIDQTAQYEALGWRTVRVGADLLRRRQDVVVFRVRNALLAAGAPY